VPAVTSSCAHSAEGPSLTKITLLSCRTRPGPLQLLFRLRHRRRACATIALVPAAHVRRTSQLPSPSPHTDIPATPQNPTPNMPPTPPAQTLPAAQHEATPPNMPPTPPARALPATQHEATPSPPGKRALSQAKPAPPQRPPPATPLAPPASAIPIEYEATVPAHPCARTMSPDKPATNSRMTRSASKRAPDANQATVHQAASDKRPKPKQEPASKPKINPSRAPQAHTEPGQSCRATEVGPSHPPLPPAPAIPTIQYEAIPQRVMRSSKRKQEPASPESIQQHKKKARQIRNWEEKCPEPKPKTTEPEAHPSEGVG